MGAVVAVILLVATSYPGPSSGPVESPVDAARAHYGIAKYYSPGMFRTVAANRGMKLRTDVDGYASTPDCSNIGRVISARIAGGPLERYQVLDCSAPRDRARHIKSGLMLEVDYQTAKRNHFVSRGRAPVVAWY